MDLLDYEKRHIDILNSTAHECTVLLKKDGSFPLLKPCKIAAFGNGVRGTIKGGTGSGEVNSREFTTIEEALEDRGFEITTKKWLDEYELIKKEAKNEYRQVIKREAKASKTNPIIYGMGKEMPEPNYTLDSDYDGEVCIYVLSRNSGEGSDRKPEEGDILLTKTETETIKNLNDRFDKFMLVINTGGVVDLSEVKDVKNILLLSQLGIATGNVLVDILLGKSNPSGKLTTTWAKYNDYYPMDDFDDIDETRYKEGIYVGYRYFDTFNIEPLFPFGFGLSYSEFERDVTDVSFIGETATIRVKVKNTGEFAGKDVIELYCSSPDGILDKAKKDLCGFAKTRLLEKGEEEILSISFVLSDIASYNSQKEAYVLEKGDYIIFYGPDSKDVKPVCKAHIDEEVIVRKVKNVFESTDFEDLKNQKNREDIFDSLPVFNISKDDIRCETVNYELNEEILPEIEKLSEDELCLLSIGNFGGGSGLSGIIGNAGTHVCGAAGETGNNISDVPYLVMADGPQGLRLSRDYIVRKGNKRSLKSPVPEGMKDYLPKFLISITSFFIDTKPKKNEKVYHQYCTAIPIGTALAQSFNLDLVKSYGDIVGFEMEKFKVDLWLAPGMNTHRSVRCGRNFEYYSEDPYLSGKIASNITQGVQKHPGCSTTIKHYAANNKELNRSSNNSIVSERALREIYLKGFGICIKESNPYAVMTSYNLINGTHTAEHRGLIWDILRCEYGFTGLVMTDWVFQLMSHSKSKYPNSHSPGVAKAGGNLFMPGSSYDYKELKKALKNGKVDIDQIKINCSHTISVIKKLKSN